MKATHQLWLPGLPRQLALLFFVLPLAVFATIASVAAQVPNTLLHTLSDPLSNGVNFGSSVAVSGSRIVVGTSGTNAYVYDLATASPTVPVTSLTYPNPESGDNFGSAVAISGTRAVVGLPGNGQGANYAGKVFVYDLVSPTPGVPVFTLTNSNLGLHDSALGVSVAISDSLVVAGAWQGNIGSLPRGSVHVFDLNGGASTMLMAILTNPGPSLSFAFGLSVAVSGAWVVVGAPGDSSGGPSSGSAYVYNLASAAPIIPFITLTNPSPTGSTDDFGYSVAISGNQIVVGVRGDDTAAADAGIAYVYDLASLKPTVPVVTLTNPSPAASDIFGYSVTLSGNLAVVGAPGDDTGADTTGIVYVFDLASAVPTSPVATLPNPDPTDFANFGGSVAVDGTTVVGARGVHVFGPAPVLGIVNSASSSATISWTPATSSGFRLQFTDSLISSNWINAPTGITNPATIPAGDSSRFYRLFKP